MTEPKQRSNPRQQPPWERDADSEGANFGPWLRQQRELREITLREISDASKINLRYLDAFEQERFDTLPAPVFANGFLRQYARYVGIDPDEAVNRFLVARGGDEGEEDDGAEEKAASWQGMAAGRWKTVALVVAIAAVLLLLVFLGPRLLDTGGAGESEVPPGVAPPDTTSVPVPARPDPRASVEDAPLVVTLDFREDCWVEASIDGDPRVAEMQVQGESLRLQAQQKIELRLGDAGAVDIEVNGEPYDFGAVPGQVRRLVIEAEGVAAPSGAAVDRSRSGSGAPG